MLFKARYYHTKETFVGDVDQVRMNKYNLFQMVFIYKDIFILCTYQTK